MYSVQILHGFPAAFRSQFLLFNISRKAQGCLKFYEVSLLDLIWVEAESWNLKKLVLSGLNEVDPSEGQRVQSLPTCRLFFFK